MRKRLLEEFVPNCRIGKNENLLWIAWINSINKDRERIMTRKLMTGYAGWIARQHASRYGWQKFGALMVTIPDERFENEANIEENAAGLDDFFE